MGARSLDELVAVFRDATMPRAEWTHAALATFEVGAPLEGRVEALLASPLGQRSALLEFWSRERLLSPAARASWVPPDLKVLPGS